MPTRDLVRHLGLFVAPTPITLGRPLHLARIPPRLRARSRAGPVWVDIGWAGFIVLNLAAMRLLPSWQTAPFLAIRVSLTAICGFQ